jgi:DNA-binding YbaB/EbfC family protein
MTEDPTPDLGQGFDLNAMLEQAQQMQSQLVAAQEELASASVQGSAGGVEVTLTGTGELTGVRIAKGYFDPEDEDSLADLGDLVVAAYRDARARTDALAQQALGPLAGGLGGLGGLGGSGGFGV